MRNNLWIGSGISGMGEIPILGRPVKGLTALIRKIFTGGVQGFAYDPNDLTTLYQDAAGTIPVTAAGQPVGLMLDKSGRSNHAYQTVSASRPVLQQTPILGTTEYVQNGKFDSDISGWGVIGGSTTKTVAWESGALKVSASTTGTCVSSGNLSTPLVIDKTYEVSCECLAHDATGGLSGVFIGDGAQTVGTVTGTGKFKFLVTAKTNTSKINFGRIGSGVASEAFSKWDNISIKEVTGYLTDQNYLKFDGVDDFLQTNSIDFTATDKLSLFAGVTKLANSTQIVAELSPSISANVGSFYLVAGTDSGGNGYVSMARGSYGVSVGRAARNFTYLAPDVAVLSVKHDISGKLSSMRRNGVIGIDGIESKGTGNFGNYPLFIGRRGGASLPFNGHLYSLIGIGRLTADSETITLEKAIAKNTGVTLNV